MSTPPPEASTEYSRGMAESRVVSGPRGEHLRLLGTRLPAAVLGGTLLGALLLVVAEFTALYSVHAASSRNPIDTVTGGSHHAYALIPIALLAAVLAYGVYRERSRPALLAIGLLGVLTLLIALLGDLPDAQASGLVGGGAAHYVIASSTPSAGLYMETLGAVVLVITCGLGFLLGAPGARRVAPPQPDTT
jgi:hypothetical protein